MQKFLPLFPLNLIAFPMEDLNLHIFEPRYRELINECLDDGKTFGIPTFLDGKLPGFGTEVKITKLSKKLTQYPSLAIKILMWKNTQIMNH